MPVSYQRRIVRLVHTRELLRIAMCDMVEIKWLADLMASLTYISLSNDSIKIIIKPFVPAGCRVGDVFAPLNRSANPLRPTFSCRYSYAYATEERLACDEDFRNFLRPRNDIFSLSSELLVIDLEGLLIPSVSSDDNS